MLIGIRVLMLSIREPQLGNGTTENVLVPIKIMDNVKSYESYYEALYIIKEDDTLCGGPVRRSRTGTSIPILAIRPISGIRGSLAVAVYVAVGLAGIPVFAAGGGIQYVFRPSFGYLLGPMAFSPSGCLPSPSPGPSA